jgi:hypothetical protein
MCAPLHSIETWVARSGPRFNQGFEAFCDLRECRLVRQLAREPRGCGTRLYATAGNKAAHERKLCCR